MSFHFESALFIRKPARVKLTYDSIKTVLIFILRYLFNKHPEDRGREPRLPQTFRQGPDQLQQKEESGRNHR